MLHRSIESFRNLPNRFGSQHFRFSAQQSTTECRMFSRKNRIEWKRKERNWRKISQPPFDSKPKTALPSLLIDLIRKCALSHSERSIVHSPSMKFAKFRYRALDGRSSNGEEIRWACLWRSIGNSCKFRAWLIEPFQVCFRSDNKINGRFVVSVWRAWARQLDVWHAHEWERGGRLL